MTGNSVLDLFSAAAGGWSLGMHRAGFHTVAACEFVDWRRALYSQNNPNSRMYDDVRTLTGERLLLDLGFLPRVVVGSPPCQDISPANTKGKGVEGERSGLYFEAVRIIGEVRPRWFTLENSSNLRTRGADAVLAALEAIGYTCWSFVVSAGDIGANHERARSWIIGCDVDQVADPSSWEQRQQPRRGLWTPRTGTALHGLHDQARPADADEAGLSSRQMEPGIREPAQPFVGRDDGRRCAVTSGAGAILPSERSEVGLRASDRSGAEIRGSQWTLDGLADHLRLDDGISTWVAQSRIAVGGPRGTSAASLIVEAFGDAVVPQIPEAIGRAILRTERALAAVYGRSAA